MEARAAAMDELEESGAFESALSTESDLDRELDEIRQTGEVDAELETLKSEAGADGDAGSGTDPETETGADADADVDIELEDGVDPETEGGTSDPEIEAELDDLKDDDT
jgi:phage shock protein A